jgi:hypothetical protein
MSVISGVSVSQPTVSQLVKSSAPQRPQTNSVPKASQASQPSGNDPDHDGDSDGGGIDVTA